MEGKFEMATVLSFARGRRRAHFPGMAVLALAVIALCGLSASAGQSVIRYCNWTGLGGNDWGMDGNWRDDMVPREWDTARFTAGDHITNLTIMHGTAQAGSIRAYGNPYVFLGGELIAQTMEIGNGISASPITFKTLVSVGDVEVTSYGDMIMADGGRISPDATVYVNSGGTLSFSRTSHLGLGTAIDFRSGTLRYIGTGRVEVERAITSRNGRTHLQVDDADAVMVMRGTLTSSTLSPGYGFSKRGPGTVELPGTQSFTGDLLLYEGTLLLSERARIIRNGNAFGHIVIRDGATLALGGRNEILNLGAFPNEANTPNVEFREGSTLSFRKLYASGSALTLNAGRIKVGTGGVLNFDVDLASLPGDGAYTLVSSDSPIFKDVDLSGAEVSVLGSAIADGSLRLSANDKGTELRLTVTDTGTVGRDPDTNLLLTWRTTGSDQQWDPATRWNGEGGATNFAVKDAVEFGANNAPVNVKVSSDVDVSSMSVAGGSYTFNGASINGLVGQGAGLEADLNSGKLIIKN